MKKLILNSAILFTVITTVLSCDKVKNVNPALAPSTTGGGSSGIDITDSTINSNPNLRKVLLEDYTGHKCGNCPVAAEKLTALELQYPHQIVPLAIHAGFFANTNLQYPTVFSTVAGNNYDTQFGISVAGNPNGLINRVGYGTGSFIKAYSSWASDVSTQLALAPKFQISLKYKYNTGTYLLNTDVKVKSLINNTGNYKLVILLTEDSIIAEQLDYRLPTGSQLIPNYKFNHVLRAAINSEWGDVIFSSGALANYTETVTKTNFQMSTTFKANKCHIIAFIYDANTASPTYYEVLQAEEIELK